MFKITQTPTFSAPVRVELPGEKGKNIKVEFTAIFKRVSQEEVEDIHDRMNPKLRLATATASDSESEAPMTDRQLIDEVLVGWAGVVGEDDQPVEFNETNLAALLAIYPTQPTIVTTFFDTLKKAKVKN